MGWDEWDGPAWLVVEIGQFGVGIKRSCAC
jgi:hypothetical protein